MSTAAPTETTQLKEQRPRERGGEPAHSPFGLLLVLLLTYVANFAFQFMGSMHFAFGNYLRADLDLNAKQYSALSGAAAAVRPDPAPSQQFL